MTIQEEGATEVDSDDMGGIDAVDYTSGGLIVLSICLGLGKKGLFNSGSIDVEETSVDGPDDVQGLDASAAHIANLLSSEPSDAATAFHSAACYAHGRFSNGVAYPTLSAIIGLSGWLPCSRTLRTKIESSQTAFRRAAALPIMLGHGRGDEAVTYRNGERSAEFLRNSGFSYLNFKAYNGLGHHTTPEEMDDVSKWLRARLGLDRSCG
ncbi:hypothetical protein VPH35_041194 [Triticum aestivum]